jgi:hypothetical protein
MTTKFQNSASSFANAWRNHEAAVNSMGLTYIDCLIGEVARQGQPSLRELKRRIARLIPNVTPRAAHQMVELKFPNLQDGDLIR